MCGRFTVKMTWAEIVAPLWPQAVQPAHRRSLSLDTFGPQRNDGDGARSGAVVEIEPGLRMLIARHRYAACRRVSFGGYFLAFWPDDPLPL
jgi:hypothetical protein